MDYADSLQAYFEMAADENRFPESIMPDGKRRILKNRGKSDPKIYLMLKQEHLPGFPEIYGVEIDSEDNTLVIEEKIEGQNLKELYESGHRFTEKEVKRLLLQLIRILKPLHHHEPQIIHRDIKPSNIILDKNNNVYLVDLDAARLYKEGQPDDTTCVGTRGFAAPEQYLMQQTDGRTDIYLLAGTANWLLTGRYPKKEHIYSNGRIGRILAKALEWDPNDRYQSLEELECALLGKPVGLRKWFPVGFRGSNVLVWLGAILMYGLIFLFTDAMTVTGSTGPVGKVEIFVTKAGTLLFLLLGVALAGNYAEIRDRLFYRVKHPAMKAVASVLFLLTFGIVEVFVGIVIVELIS